MSRVVEVLRRGRRGDDGFSGLTGVVTTATAVTLSADSSGKIYRCTASLTLTFPAASGLPDGWNIIVDADGGSVTLSAASQINGAASLVVSNGATAQIYCDGTTFYARFFLADSLTSVTAGQVENTSNVAGVSVEDALNELDGGLRPVDFSTTGYMTVDADADTASSKAAATSSNIRALSGNGPVEPAVLAAAAAFTNPSGASNWTPDWDSFINATWQLTGNRTMQNPTDVIAGTTRVVKIVGNDGTTRTISWGSAFKGTLPTSVTSTSAVLVTLYAVSSSEIVVASVNYTP